MLRAAAWVTGAATLWACGLPPAAAQEGAWRMSELEAGIVREHNAARTNPAGYAELLEERLRYFDGTLLRLPDRRAALVTNEGPAAVQEAARFLRGVSALQPLESSDGLSRAAQDHVRDQGPDGSVGHTGSDGSGPGDRATRYGAWSGMVAENISYGFDDARSVVIQLLVDDGVPGRGHRANIFNTDLHRIGVACGPHEQFGVMCTITYADGFEEGGD